LTPRSKPGYTLANLMSVSFNLF